MRYQLLSFSCALLGGSLFREAVASCYYPDGSFPEDYIYTECGGGSDGFSSCCILEDGNQCLSNGLCYSSSSDYMYRGGCSDKSWQSGSCFQHCKGSASDYTSSSWDQLVSCGDNKYCCYADGSTCCNDDSKVFTVDSASVIKDLSSTASYSLPIESPTPTATTAKHSKPVTTAAAATSTAEPNSSQSDSHSHSVSKTAVIAGAAAGVVILLVAIVLVFFLVRRRYRKKLATGSKPQSFPMSSDGFQKLPDNQSNQQLPDKSPRPVEVPAPSHSPAPPYQPPAYAPPQPGAVEIDNSYRVPAMNQWGQPVFEAPTQPYQGT